MYAARDDLWSPIRFYFHVIVPTWVRREVAGTTFRTHVGTIWRAMKLTATYILPTNTTLFRFAGIL
jgi:hypothetical protein